MKCLFIVILLLGVLGLFIFKNNYILKNVKHIIQCLHLNDKIYPNRQIVPMNLANIPIYYINLEKSLNRKKYIEMQANYYNIQSIQRIDAINGRNIVKNYNGKMEYGTYNNILLYTKPTHYHLTDSELGCTLSHLKAIKQAYEDNEDMVFIMEDDTSFDIVPHWNKTIYDIIQEVPSDWEVINLCPDRRYCDKVKENIIPWREKMCMGAVIYLINRKGMEKIMDIMRQGYVQFDKIDYTEIEQRIPGIKGKKCFKNLVADCLIYILTNTYQYTKKSLFFPNTVGSTINSNIIRVTLMNQRSLDLLKDYRSEYEKCQ